MNHSLNKIQSASTMICTILKMGLVVAAVGAALELAAFGILLFSGEAVKRSFLRAFQVTANNGTTLEMGQRQLLLLLALALLDMLLIALILHFTYAVFDATRKDGTPFSRQNTGRIRKIAQVTAVIGAIGGGSDALVDYYTIGEWHWGVSIACLVIAGIIYCISLIFSYGCDLQKEYDETL